MKKAIYESLYKFVKGEAIDNLDEVKEALETELNRGKEQKEANAKAYDSIRELVFSNLGNTPVTLGELYDAIKDQLPSDMTKGKVQHAVTKLWADEIVKVEGKPNMYKLA